MVESVWSITLEDVAQSPVALGVLVALLMQLLGKPLIRALVTHIGRPAVVDAEWVWQDVVTNGLTFLLALGGAFLVQEGIPQVILHAILGTGVAVFGYEAAKNIYSGATEDLKWR